MSNVPHKRYYKLKLVSGYRDSKIGLVFFDTLGMVAVLCFKLLFYFLMFFRENVIFLSHTV